LERDVSPRFRSGFIPEIISAAPSAEAFDISDVYTILDLYASAIRFRKVRFLEKPPVI